MIINGFFAIGMVLFACMVIAIVLCYAVSIVWGCVQFTPTANAVQPLVKKVIWMVGVLYLTIHIINDEAVLFITHACIGAVSYIILECMYNVPRCIREFRIAQAEWEDVLDRRERAHLNTYW